MSSQEIAHIAYELIDDPRAAIVEFLQPLDRRSRALDGAEPAARVAGPARAAQSVCARLQEGPHVLQYGLWRPGRPSCSRCARPAAWSSSATWTSSSGSAPTSSGWAIMRRSSRIARRPSTGSRPATRPRRSRSSHEPRHRPPVAGSAAPSGGSRFRVQVLEQPDGGVDQSLARALGTSGADHLVIPLGIGPPGGDVADRAVGQLGDDRAGEWRVLLDRQAQLDEDLAGQRDPRQLVAQGDDLHLDLQRPALPRGDVPRLERLHHLEEARPLRLRDPRAAPRPRGTWPRRPR